MKNASLWYSWHSAFTMIELIFVIVILGILSAVALPKFVGTKNQADISSGRADVSVIRSAIVSERQTQLVKGINSYISTLSDNNTTLFTGDGNVTNPRKLLMYGIKAGTNFGDWAVTNADKTTYSYTTSDGVNSFVYTPANGKFVCSTGENCSALTE
ncbi:MAG: prepilin-type N-terminal cleavage/methylation domain-containing protein [Sulfurimonas sp.]|nr:prepilin-type N-terminal cleavage/methylation domain-containing protein [Sulfurimonas sp.]